MVLSNGLSRQASRMMSRSRVASASAFSIRTSETASSSMSASLSSRASVGMRKLVPCTSMPCPAKNTTAMSATAGDLGKIAQGRHAAPSPEGGFGSRTSHIIQFIVVLFRHWKVGVPPMTQAIKLKDITIHPVVEQQAPFFDAFEFFPTLTKELFEENRSWLQPA